MCDLFVLNSFHDTTHNTCVRNRTIIEWISPSALFMISTNHSHGHEHKRDKSFFNLNSPTGLYIGLNNVYVFKSGMGKLWPAGCLRPVTASRAARYVCHEYKIIILINKLKELKN